MAFALQKARERGPRATIFKINGQRRTVGEIEKYWKRTSKALRPIPATPDGLTYSTPSPGPQTPNVEKDLSVKDADHELSSFVFQYGDFGVDMIQEPVPESPEAFGYRQKEKPIYETKEVYGVQSPLHYDRQVYSFQDFYQQSSRSSSTHWYSIRTPEPLITPHQGLHYANVFCQSYKERRGLGIYEAEWDRDGRTIFRFQKNVDYIRTASGEAHHQGGVELAWAEIFSDASGLVKATRPLVLAATLRALLLFFERKIVKNTTDGVAQSAWKTIVSVVVRGVPASHPVSMLLQALSRSPEILCVLALKNLRMMTQFLEQAYGLDDLEFKSVLYQTAAAHNTAGDAHVALEYAQKMHNHSLSILGDATDHRILQRVLDSQLYLAESHLRLGNYDAVKKLVTKGLHLNSTQRASKQRDRTKARFLHYQGVVAHNMGNLQEPVEYFSLALQIGLKINGPEHYNTVVAARWLKLCIAKKDEIANRSNMEA
jgi:tetratricopeptide (TPR) repeat protein